MNINKGILTLELIVQDYLLVIQIALAVIGISVFCAIVLCVQV